MCDYVHTVTNNIGGVRYSYSLTTACIHVVGGLELQFFLRVFIPDNSRFFFLSQTWIVLFSGELQVVITMNKLCIVRKHANPSPGTVRNFKSPLQYVVSKSSIRLNW